MMQLVLFRSIALCAGIVLLIHASAGIFQQLTRPSLRGAAFFADGPKPATDKQTAAAASWITFNGEILSDLAAAQSQLALDGNAFNPSDRAAQNATAQAAMTSALAMSPINSSAWLILGLLKAQANEAATGPIKTSYFTGPVAPEGLVRRIRAVTGTQAVLDEDIRLLANSDIRTILTRYGRLEPALAATYRQATEEGRKYLLEATQLVDPKFSSILRQYQ